MAQGRTLTDSNGQPLATLADTETAPRLPKFVSTLDDHSSGVAAAAPGANVGVGARIVAPETGTINAISFFIVVSGGNVDVGAYNTAVTTRVRLASSGAITVGTANAWQAPITVNLPVVSGVAIDLVASFSSGAAVIAGVNAVGVPMALLPTGWVVVPLGGSPQLWWSAAAVHPLPATISEASLTNAAFKPLIIAKYA